MEMWFKYLETFNDNFITSSVSEVSLLIGVLIDMAISSNQTSCDINRFLAPWTQPLWPTESKLSADCYEPCFLFLELRNLQITLSIGAKIPV